MVSSNTGLLLIQRLKCLLYEIVWRYNGKLVAPNIRPITSNCKTIKNIKVVVLQAASLI